MDIIHTLQVSENVACSFLGTGKQKLVKQPCRAFCSGPRCHNGVASTKGSLTVTTLKSKMNSKQIVDR